MFPLDMMQDYPPGEGYVLRIRIVEDDAGFMGEGFIQHKDDNEGNPILVAIPDDLFPVVSVRTATDAKRPWIELARLCGYDILWVEKEKE
jgi:hypothetical protein